MPPLRGHHQLLAITHIWTREGWLYLAVIIDLYSQRVIGWAVRNRLKKDLAIRALQMAIDLRNPPKGCMHHTDRGSQYCAHEYQKILRQYGFQVSMSPSRDLQSKPCQAVGRGNCWEFKLVRACRLNDPLGLFKGAERDHRDLLQDIEG